MLTYYISGSNGFTFRTQPTSSNEYTLSLQDMYTYENLTASMVSTSYEGYESYISFTASIDGVDVGSEYRAKLFNSGSQDPIWHGTLQVYTSQSIDKASYKNQNDGFVSHITPNEYIILE